jgi:hypothetical protein
LHSHTRGSVAFEQSDQQVGSSWFLTRDTWNTYGPLDTQLPIGSDDVRFCERVTIAGFWVGSISPHQVFHCGATNSEGQWSPGGTELIHTTPPKGVIIK